MKKKIYFIEISWEILRKKKGYNFKQIQKKNIHENHRYKYKIDGSCSLSPSNTSRADN
jgi:hypothetical protein